MPQDSRLPKEEFRARGYKTTATPFFLVKTKRNGLGYSRIGIVIGKAIYKEATKRNFWKRQIKMGILQKTKDGKIPRGGNDFLIIFISNKKLALTKKQLQEDLEKIITNIK